MGIQRFEDGIGMEAGRLRQWNGAAMEDGIIRRFDGTNYELAQPESLAAPTGVTAVRSATSPTDTIDCECDVAPAGTLFDTYVLEQSLTGGAGTWSEAATVARGALPSVEVTGLEPDTTYFFRWRYRVDFVKGAGLLGTPGSSVSESTAATALPAPTLDLLLADVDAWDTTIGEVAGATGYEHRRSSDGGSTWLGGGDGWVDLGTTRVFTDDNGGAGLATDGEVWTVQARAYDGSGPGAAVEETITMPTLNPPTGVSATPNGEARVDIAWTPGAGSLGFSPETTEIHRSTTGPSGGFGHVVDDPTSPYIDQGHPGGTEAWWKLRSQFTSTQTSLEYFSEFSDVVTATYPLESFAIFVRDEAGTADAVEVSVDGDTAPTSGVLDQYDVYYRVDQSMGGDVGTGTLLGSFTPAQIEDVFVQIDGLSVGQEVFVIVQALTSDDHVFAVSPEESAVVAISAPTAAPTITDSGGDDTSEADPFVFAVFSLPADATGAEAEVRSDASSPISTVYQLPDADAFVGSTCAAFGQDPETQGLISESRFYQIRVRAVNAAGAGPWAETGEITGEFSGVGPCTPSSGT